MKALEMIYYLTRNQVYGNVPRVRIPTSPPIYNPEQYDVAQKALRNQGFFFIYCPMRCYGVC